MRIVEGVMASGPTKNVDIGCGTRSASICVVLGSKKASTYSSEYASGFFEPAASHLPAAPLPRNEGYLDRLQLAVFIRRRSSSCRRSRHCLLPSTCRSLSQTLGAILSAERSVWWGSES